MVEPGSVVVWGNCQAEPIAALLTGPLAEHGLQVHRTPPVFLIDEAGLARVRDLVSRAEVLISQPISDNYRVPGCGTAQLAALLPATGRLITYPVSFHLGQFPYQVNAHGGDGARVAAPLTDYHDLRTIVAAERRLTVEAALAWWPEPNAEAVRTISSRSVATLATREAGLDVTVSDLVDAPDAMMTISHPRNALLGRVATALLTELGCTDVVTPPAREFLGARRAPLEPAVVRAHGWSAEHATTRWVIDGHPVAPEVILAAQLDFYRARPDVITDARTRFAERLAVLEL